MDFSQIINRNNTGSVKWDFIERHFGDGAGKLLPMWVSDFDFACPPEVQTALHQRVEHGVFGYSERDEAYFNALLHWFSSRHQLTLKQEWVCSVEGVVPGLALLVQMLTHPGDGVVVQGPYYGSFAKIITLNITWRKTAAGLLNRQQYISPGHELSRRREPIYYGWIVKNWDWMTNS